MLLKIREPAAMAAAVSPATSLPGFDSVILKAGLAIVMSSGLPQNPWSGPPSPTYNTCNFSFNTRRMVCL